MNRTEELRQLMIQRLKSDIGAFDKYGKDEYHDDMVHVNIVTARRTLELLKKLEVPVYAQWKYYTNDEGKARWKCSSCGHIVKHDPNDYKRCACGAHMEKEA